MKDTVRIREKESGFSLIELLVVIVIIAILAAIAIRKGCLFESSAGKSECHKEQQRVESLLRQLGQPGAVFFVLRARG
jgi:prepilin-type N-terminal cleavage/methylation domain-containing protein